MNPKCPVGLDCQRRGPPITHLDARATARGITVPRDSLLSPL